MSYIIDRFCKLLDVANEEATVVSSAAAAAAVALTVLSTSGFAANDYIIVGDPGVEGSELVQVTGITSGTILAVTALARAHGVKTSVIRAPYNQIKVYRSDTESGVYAEIAASPADMEIDQPFTYFIDATGSAAKYYKYSYYNETTAAESSLSSAVLGAVSSQIMTLEELKGELNIKLDDKSHDKMLTNVIARATQRVQTYTKIDYIARVVTDEYYDIEDMQDTIFTQYYPIYGTPTVVENGTTLTYSTDPDTTEFFYYEGMIVRNQGYFYPGNKRLKVSYTAYRTIPEDVKQAAIEIAAILSGLKTRTFVDGEGISRAVVLRNIPDEVWKTLDQYKRIKF